MCKRVSSWWETEGRRGSHEGQREREVVESNVPFAAAAKRRGTVLAPNWGPGTGRTGHGREGRYLPRWNATSTFRLPWIGHGNALVAWRSTDHNWEKWGSRGRAGASRETVSGLCNGRNVSVSLSFHFHKTGPIRPQPFAVQCPLPSALCPQSINNTNLPGLGE